MFSSIEMIHLPARSDKLNQAFRQLCTLNYQLLGLGELPTTSAHKPTQLITTKIDNLLKSLQQQITAWESDITFVDTRLLKETPLFKELSASFIDIKKQLPEYTQAFQDILKPRLVIPSDLFDVVSHKQAFLETLQNCQQAIISHHLSLIRLLIHHGIGSSLTCQKLHEKISTALTTKIMLLKNIIDEINARTAHTESASLKKANLLHDANSYLKQLENLDKQLATITTIDSFQQWNIADAKAAKKPITPAMERTPTLKPSAN